jgi:hypothetical protein
MAEAVTVNEWPAFILQQIRLASKALKSRPKCVQPMGDEHPISE